MSTALAIFVKTPGFSPLKTRLASALGQAAAEYFHLLGAAAVAAVVRSSRGITPFWAVAESAPDARANWPDFAVISQGEGGLGARLDQVYRHLLANHERVLLIGADAPQITPALLQSAIAAMDDARTPFVIGNALDGGFWLFGGRMPIAAHHWQAVTYSRPDTSAQLQMQLRNLGGIAELPRLGDVDTVEDLPVLQRELAALQSPLPEQRELAQWLAKLSPNGRSPTGADIREPSTDLKESHS